MSLWLFKSFFSNSQNQRIIEAPTLSLAMVKFEKFLKRYTARSKSKLIQIIIREVNE